MIFKNLTYKSFFAGTRVSELNKLAFSVFVVLGLAAYFVYLGVSSYFLEQMTSSIYRKAGQLILSLIPFIIIFAFFSRRYLMALALFFLVVGARVSEAFSVDLFGLDFNLDFFIVILLFACFSLTDQPLASFFKLKNNKAVQYYFYFILVGLMSTIYANEVVAYERFWTSLFPSFLYFILMTLLVRRWSDFEFFMKCLVGVLGLSVLYGFKQIAPLKSLYEIIHYRLPSIYYNPIIYAGALILLVPSLLFFFKRSPKIIQLMIMMLWMASCLHMFLTESRGALIIFFLQHAVVGYVLFYKQLDFKSYLIKGIGILAVGVFLARDHLDKIQDLFRRFQDLDFTQPGNSAYERIVAIKGAVAMGAENILGVGLGRFSVEYLNTLSWKVGVLRLESAHNFFLNIFAELGPIALLFFIIFNTIVIKNIFWLYKAKLISQITFLTLLLSFSGYFLYANLFYGEFQHKNSSLPYFLFLTVCGLVNGLYSEKIKEEKVEIFLQDSK